MKVKLIPLTIFLLFSLQLNAQKIKVVDFAHLEKELKSSSDTIKVVNFWATWCGPCIEEMKYFVQAQEKYKDKKVCFIYVSLDFSKFADKAEALADKKGLNGKLFLLKDDPNVYVNKIDKNWEGQIPITLLVLKKGEYIFHESAFTSFEELDNFISKNL